MLHRLKVVSLSATAAFIPAMFVASSVSSAPHDGPGAGCVTHVGVTYLIGSRVYSEGSAGCDANADRVGRTLSVSIQETRWWGWNGIGTHSESRIQAPFALWLPLDRRSNCPRNYRGHVNHYAGSVGNVNRYTNTASC